MDIAAHALPEANNAVLLDASNSGFSWAVCRFCRRIWGVDILKWTCWWEEHLGVDTNATAFTAFTAFHEFARANTSEFHFHGSSWFQVNLRAERVSLQCMCYTQSPKYVQSLPVQRRVWYCGIFLRKEIVWKKRPIGSLAHLIIIINLMPHMKDGKNIQKPVLSLEQSRWVVKSDLDVGLLPPDLTSRTMAKLHGQTANGPIWSNGMSFQNALHLWFDYETLSNLCKFS